jgi:hypothetical protein
MAVDAQRLQDLMSYFSTLVRWGEPHIYYSHTVPYPHTHRVRWTDKSFSAIDSCLILSMSLDPVVTPLKLLPYSTLRCVLPRLCGYSMEGA